VTYVTLIVTIGTRCFLSHVHPKTLFEIWIICLDRVSANSEKGRGSEWAVRVRQRLQSRFGQSGAVRELNLVQIVEELLAIRGGLPSTWPFEPVFGWRCCNVLRGLWRGAAPPTAWTKTYTNFSTRPVLDTQWNFISAFEGADTLSGPPMSLRPARNMSFGRWLLVAFFSSVKNRNVSGPHLFPSVTTHAKKSLCLPRTVLHRAKKSLCNRSQFRTLFLPHRFIKIRPSHQRPVSVEFLTICRISPPI